jgi:hypothetical protein
LPNPGDDPWIELIAENEQELMLAMEEFIKYQHH